MIAPDKPLFDIGPGAPELPPRPTCPPFVGLSDLPALLTLRARPQWVPWRHHLTGGDFSVRTGKVRPFKWVKKPIDVRTDTGAKVNDPATWTIYSEAAAFAMEHGCPGVGFMLAPDDNLGAGDLDDVRDPDSGALADWAAELVARSETFCEVSPSGKGLHFIGLGKPETAHVCQPAQVELYGRVRWLAMTGRHVPGTPDEIRPAPVTFAALVARVEEHKARIAAEALAKRAAEGQPEFELRPRDPSKPPTYLDNVNAAAFAAAFALPALWVVDLFGGSAEPAAAGGWRVRSACLGRDNDEDLALHPLGFKDWGVHDLGDPRGGKRGAVDLVVEWGVFYGHFDAEPSLFEAAHWLCGKLGVPPESLGWRQIGNRERHFDAEATAEAEKAEDTFGQGHNSRGAADLSEPLDLFSLRRPVPPTDLPEACVPPVIERWAADTAERMGAPLAFTALSALATLSAAIGARLRLQPKKFDTGWTTPAFLWVALVENPGGKKSPAIGAATRVLTKLSAEHGTADQAKWKAWEKASRSRKADANPGPEPRIRRYSTDSFTIESLRRILHDNSGGVLVSSDELTVVFGALDAYKANKGADRPMFLRLFDGGEVTVDRVNTTHHVANFGAAIIGGIQPKVIAKMAPDLDADGLLQRFVLINGDGRALAGVDRAPDASAQAAYDRLVIDLATADFRFPAPITIGDDARPLWEGMDRKIERLGGFPHLSDAWRGHLNKWPAIFARLLLVFHVAERWGELGLRIEGSAVARGTAERASRMADFLIAQSIFFYEHYVGLGTGADDLLWFAGHLLVSPEIALFTERDLYQARRELRGPGKREARRDLINQIQLAGWCEADEPTRSGSPQWRVNPLIHTRFAHEAERERREREDLRRRMTDAFTERTRMADCKR